MAMVTLYRIEGEDGLYWTGRQDFFSYDEMDAELFDTEDEAIEASAHLQGVTVERFQKLPRSSYTGHNAASRLEYAFAEAAE